MLFKKRYDFCRNISMPSINQPCPVRKCTLSSYGQEIIFFEENRKDLFILFYFGVPHLATFISSLIEHVIVRITYIHPVYGGIQTHNLFDVSLLPYPIDQARKDL
jgi:hypothetical protein